jgi:hypothetical protein
MFAFICKAYINLQGGEVQKSDLDETDASVQFTLPN